MRKAGRMILLWLLNILISAGVGFGLLCVAYTIPTKQIDDHVRESAIIFEREGAYPVLYDWCTSELDSWTDALMLLTAADGREDSLVNKTLLNRRGIIQGLQDPSKVLIAHYLEEMEYSRHSMYARYWHGYLIFLKPLLFFVRYGAIRKINAIAQIAMVLLICYLLYRRKRVELIIPWLIIYLMLMPVALAKSLQFSACFYVSCIAVVALLLLRDKRHADFIFLYSGILTAYFDLLTYPAATFVIPAAIYLALFAELSAMKDICRLFRLGICWASGYGGMWAAKWILGNLFTNTDVIQNAVNEFQLRSGTESADGNIYYGLGACLGKNLSSFFQTPFSWLIVVLLAMMIILLIRSRKRQHQPPTEEMKNWTNMMIPYFLLATIPFTWFAFTRNHSSVHYWFTNKAISGSAFALMCGALQVGKEHMSTFESPRTVLR